MKSFLSIVVLTASFALLVPDNGAQAVDAGGAFRPLVAAGTHGVVGAPALAERAAESEPAATDDMSWLLALGFLGAVIARRLRAD